MLWSEEDRHRLNFKQIFDPWCLKYRKRPGVVSTRFCVLIQYQRSILLLLLSDRIAIRSVRCSLLLRIQRGLSVSVLVTSVRTGQQLICTTPACDERTDGQTLWMQNALRVIHTVNKIEWQLRETRNVICYMYNECTAARVDWVYYDSDHYAMKLSIYPSVCLSVCLSHVLSSKRCILGL